MLHERHHCLHGSHAGGGTSEEITQRVCGLDGPSILHAAGRRRNQRPLGDHEFSSGRAAGEKWRHEWSRTPGASTHLEVEREACCLSRRHSVVLLIIDGPSTWLPLTSTLCSRRFHHACMPASATASLCV